LVHTHGLTDSSLLFSSLLFSRQVAFAALDSLHPISHAVANTIKRVVIIVVSVIVFRNPVRAISTILILRG